MPGLDLREALAGSDYRPEIFGTSDERREVAEEPIADASRVWPRNVVTKISEAGRLWQAEAEDQDYGTVVWPDDVHAPGGSAAGSFTVDPGKRLTRLV